MLVKANYLGVIMIWSTTPIAIKWSAEGTDFVFAVTSRMVIGVILAFLLVKMLRLPMDWHKKAVTSYLAAGLGIYGAMMCVYWSAQYIPSGWISVLFGFTPIVTGLMASRFLGESRLTPVKLAGLLLSVVGLIAIFYSSNQFSSIAWIGVVGILAAVMIHSASTILVKAAGYPAHGLVMTAGGLVVAVPFYILTWVVAGMDWPQYIEPKAGWSILYLGVVATVVGFAMFFYVLRHVETTRVALLTLITPVLALWLGNVFNSEAISISLVIGTGLILSGLFFYEWDERLYRIKTLIG